MFDFPLQIVCNTHNPATAAAQDADADPTWAIYEGNSQIAMLSGTMALRDPLNTVGLYYAEIDLGSAWGFEYGKQYTVYITATVGGITGTMSHVFTMGPEIPRGAIEYTYTVTNSVTGFPVADVTVWITTDVTGLNVIWSGITDAFGVARDALGNKPWLDQGVYFFWRHRAGYTDIDPDQETVD